MPAENGIGPIEVSDSNDKLMIGKVLTVGNDKESVTPECKELNNKQKWKMEDIEESTADFRLTVTDQNMPKHLTAASSTILTGTTMQRHVLSY